LRTERRPGGPPSAWPAALTVATSGVLLAFQALAHPEVTDLAARLPVAAFGNVVLAGVCCSVVNALLEEVVFRGVLWGVLADEWNRGVALVATTVLFGLGHLHGYPPGTLWALLSGLYSLDL